MDHKIRASPSFPEITQTRDLSCSGREDLSVLYGNKSDILLNPSCLLLEVGRPQRPENCFNTGKFV